MCHVVLPCWILCRPPFLVEKTVREALAEAPCSVLPRCAEVKFLETVPLLANQLPRADLPTLAAALVEKRCRSPGSYGRNISKLELWVYKPNEGDMNGDFMGFYGILWDFMGFYGILWDFMGFYGILSDFMGFYGILWDFMGFYGILWDFMGFYGIL